MFSARVIACAILLLLAQPALAQVQRDATRLPSQAPVGQAVGPTVQPSPSVSGPSQAQRDAARREADKARINEGMNEAREQADKRMDAANNALVTGVASGASQIGAGVATQSPIQQGQDIEALTQQTLGQAAQDATADLRDNMSAVQRENQRRRALRARAACLRDAANAAQCPCPSGTQQVNGQCVAAGN